MQGKQNGGSSAEQTERFIDPADKKDVATIDRSHSIKERREQSDNQRNSQMEGIERSICSYFSVKLGSCFVSLIGKQACCYVIFFPFCF